MGNLKADTRFAIELEEKGFKYYASAGGRASNPLVSATLKGLAEREKVHIEKIKEFYQNLAGGKNLPADWIKNTGVAPDKAQLLKPILERLKNSLSQKFDAQENNNEVYMTAENLERDSFTLYKKIAQETADPIAKKFYSALAQEEEDHYSILEDTLLYLNQPGEWFRIQEKWIVEG